MHLDNVDGRLTLKQMLKKDLAVSVWTGFIWLRIEDGD
jgi:hypothetical protein